MEEWIAREGLRLVPRDRLRAISRKSDLRGWLQAGSFAGALAVTTAGLLNARALTAVAVAAIFIAHGVLLNCLYAGQHELSHWTAFRTKWLNDRVGELFGFLTLNPFHTDRWAHFAHHRSTQDPGRDSELVGMNPFTPLTYALNLVGIDFWRRRIVAILRAAAGQGLEADYWLTPAQARAVVLEARVTVALWLVIAAASAGAGSWLAVTLWVGPLLTTKVVHQLQNTGEHTEMPHDPDIFRNTRTLVGPPPMRWLMWNMSYHTAHHAFPGVPFHALQALHREIVQAGGPSVIERGYLQAQRDIFASLARRAS
ncbi:MAG: rhizopine catabolism protein [Caulobacteraceae bacterium]|nr:rhizopine catabolism protein [Caulobacteraceae bacterium]